MAIFNENFFLENTLELIADLDNDFRYRTKKLRTERLIEIYEKAANKNTK